MPKEKEYSGMTKDKLMTYTFVALLIIAVITIVMWWDVYALDVMTMQPIGMQYGLTVLINCLIAVGIAVGIDILLYKVASDSPLNIMSAAVFGLIVSLSYTIGEPVMRGTEVMPLFGPDAFVFVAFITVVGMVIFKKLARRKYVNPAAAAKLVVLGIAGLFTILIPADHLITGALQFPSLAGPIGYDIISGNGASGFGYYLVGCFANPASPIPTGIPTQSEIFNLFLVTKFHSWAGGASSIAVIIVGIALFVLARIDISRVLHGDRSSVDSANVYWPADIWCKSRCADCDDSNVHGLLGRFDTGVVSNELGFTLFGSCWQVKAYY